ncbi:hypothetical protein Cflav_PD3182 [Pedosphaera parvula Ellin514]|uniref:Uncharacterized protein n=1 Tax=Pedosphaera parvula (strain Ellin514) TaxID=320771 RepID=B9XJ85_PEDPL|nr:hypothetical protein Cflav_PD3182 [Pedosphaera parvula Ellin514]
MAGNNRVFRSNPILLQIRCVLPVLLVTPCQSSICGKTVLLQREREKLFLPLPRGNNRRMLKGLL